MTTKKTNSRTRNKWYKIQICLCWLSLAVPPDIWLSLYLSPFCSVTWMDTIDRLQYSWVWRRGSPGRRSKESEAGVFITGYQSSWHRTLQLSLCTVPWTLPTHIPSGTSVIMCLPTTRGRGLNCMIYLYLACTFGNSPFIITPSSEFLIWAHHLFLAELWWMQAEWTLRISFS